MESQDAPPARNSAASASIWSVGGGCDMAHPNELYV
jgi:hypothetical protein